MKESRRITPLRTILRNCLNHIENLESNPSNCDNYDKEFQDLKQFSDSLKVQEEFACTEGEKEVNRKKNRYKDILPFNISRVILNEYAGVPGSDYINANFIKGASGSPAYIASQGPLPNTVNDFWRMVVECEVQVIIMACNAQESGKHKCENYWVEKEGEEKRFGMVQLCLVKASTVCPDFLVRTMRLKYTNDKDITEERTVCQFHYSAWPDHGVPPLVRPLLDMVRLVRDTQASETLPVLVHCSAGCGRTGTICAIDFVWGLLRAGKLTEDFSLFNLVRDMRKQRVAMVQTKEQYILVHQAVRELFKEQLQVIESHPYENIDFNGVPLIKEFEEPFYDTIGIKKEENGDEKQDKSEVKEKGDESDIKACKADAAPPLPRKKRPNVLFSKQEKEAENLTEKNRLSYAEKEKDKADATFSTLLGKPRIVKLRALFEKNPIVKERSVLKDKGSQTVLRSHSLGAIKRPVAAEVFESGVEKPKSQSSTQEPNNSDPVKLKNSKSFSKPVPLIKRSKSFKTFNQPHALTVPSSIFGDHKSIKCHPSKSHFLAEIGSSNKSNAAPKKPDASAQTLNVTDAPMEFSKDSSKRRRRSLESLMGEILPAITWPTTVASNNKSNVNQSFLSRLNLLGSQNSKAVEIIREQLSGLNIETEKRNLVSNQLGTRERRHSFRQAVDKSDICNSVVPDVCSRPFESKNSTSKNYVSTLSPEGVKNFSEIPSQGSEITSSKLFESNVKSEITTEHTAGGKLVFDGNRHTNQEPIQFSPFENFGSPVKKIHTKQPANDSIVTATKSLPDNKIGRQSMRPIASDSRNSNGSYDELDLHAASKNLFLKKLNSEILLKKERDSGIREKFAEQGPRISVKNAEQIPECFPSAQISNLVNSRTSSTKMGVPSGGQFEDVDEFDGPMLFRSHKFEGVDKIAVSPQRNFYFRPDQTCRKQSKASTSSDECKSNNAVASSSANAHAAECLRKDNSFSRTGGDVLSVNSKKTEPAVQDVRRREILFSYLYKKNLHLGIAPNKKSKSGEDESETLGNCRKPANPIAPNSSAAINSVYDDALDKKRLLPSKSSSAVKKGQNLSPKSGPWPSHLSSSGLSPDETSCEPLSAKSNCLHAFPLYQPDISSETEVGRRVQAEAAEKIHSYNNSAKSNRDYNAAGTAAGKQRRRDEASDYTNMFYNYGGFGAFKTCRNTIKYSKDDFLLSEEPTAPPRVKRHASVTIPRSCLSSADHVSPLIDGKFGIDGKKTVKADVNDEWNKSLGVDLDAVAASMRKGETVLQSGGWAGKNHAAVSSVSGKKKKQHYF